MIYPIYLPSVISRILLCLEKCQPNGMVTATKRADWFAGNRIRLHKMCTMSGDMGHEGSCVPWASFICVLSEPTGVFVHVRGTARPMTSTYLNTCCLWLWRVGQPCVTLSRQDRKHDGHESTDVWISGAQTCASRLTLRIDIRVA